MQIADLQAEIAGAMLTAGDLAHAPIVGGADPMRRFAIHSRHYAASVARVIVERFAATVWLVGSAAIVRAAANFIREHPPTGPCMAEYGEAFPAFLEAHGDGALPPYVKQFATMDWHLGRVAIGCDRPALTDLSRCDPAQIADAIVMLQDPLVYLHIDWSLDELMSFYLSGDAPDSYALRQESVGVEVRGSRGGLSMQRLAWGEFLFRSALSHGATLADAATAAADADATFSPTEAVPRLLGEGLVTGIRIAERKI
jgi:putative DNA-binding protein